MSFVIFTLLAVCALYVISKMSRRRASAQSTLHSRPATPTASQAEQCQPDHSDVATVVKKETTSRNRRVRRAAEMIVQTPLGPVTIRKRRKAVGAVVVACGQSEAHLNWYFNVYRRRILREAVSKLNAYERGTEDGSYWSESYLAFLERAPAELATLDEERDRALRANRDKIDRKEASVIGIYESLEKAQEGATWLGKVKEPTLNAGWLQVHVVAIPDQ